MIQRIPIYFLRYMFKKLHVIYSVTNMKYIAEISDSITFESWKIFKI
jgi:hypothetical protein